MSQILVLLRKSLLTYRRARAAVAVTFLVPVVLIYLFGHVFGLYRNDPGPAGIPVAVVNESSEPAALELVDALKAERALSVITSKKTGSEMLPLSEADVRAGLHNNEYRFALILPTDLLSEKSLGVRLKFLSNPRNEIEAQMVNGVLQKTIFSKVPQLLGQSLQRRARSMLGDAAYNRFNRGIASTVANAFGADARQVELQLQAGSLLGGFPSPAAANKDGPKSNQDNEADLFSRMVKIETEQVGGKDVKNPMAARLVGGYAIMFLLFAVSGSAASLFEEKSSGVFQRLLSAPVRPAHIVGARFLFGVVLGLVQIAALLIAGRLFFKLELVSHLPALIAIALASAAACSGFGILVAAVSPSAAAAHGIATFIVISMSAVGGAWFPVSFMPTYIQAVSKLTVVYWATEGITDVLWAGHGLREVLPKAGVLVGISALTMAFALWRFRRTRFFEA